MMGATPPSFGFGGQNYSGAGLGLGLGLNPRQRAAYRASQANPNSGYGAGLPMRARRSLMMGSNPTLAQVAQFNPTGRVGQIAQRRATAGMAGGPDIAAAAQHVAGVPQG